MKIILPWGISILYDYITLILKYIYMDFPEKYILFEFYIIVSILYTPTIILNNNSYYWLKFHIILLSYKYQFVFNSKILNTLRYHS